MLEAVEVVDRVAAGAARAGAGGGLAGTLKACSPLPLSEGLINEISLWPLIAVFDQEIRRVQI